MDIEYAKSSDIDFINKLDTHITKEELLKSILNSRVIICKENRQVVGWARYNLFWDNIPFLNMLFILEEYRNQGVGKRLVEFWESEMKQRNYSTLMTSSLSDETAQHFYRKLGYRDSGSLILENETLEIIFTKKI